MKAQSETRSTYKVAPEPNDDDVIAAALAILRLRVTAVQLLGSPQDVRDYLAVSMGDLEHEEFGCLWLDAQNRLIFDQRIFRGTLTQTSVYPREIVKDALNLNAAGVIFYHNHPSGVAEPSRADEALTTQLKTALALVDVKVLDHIIAAGGKSISLAERGVL
jgi:DNA repair protein RadC